jgi:hypothetical protein
MVRRIPLVLPLVMAAAWSLPAAAQQCCLSELFAGCGGCLRRPPAYAVAPVMAPMMAPMPAPPQPVMVPVAKTSYVPETTYRTQMQTVPVTTYKPSCEIDPCTGCPRECMQPVTEYVQQAVNVPVTQYRAVTTTQYVQVPQGYAAPPYAPGQMPPAPMMAPPAVQSPFAPQTIAPPPAINTAPGAWGAASSDLRNPALVQPGQTSITPPALPPTTTNYPPYAVQRPVAPPVGGVPYGQPQNTYGQPPAAYGQPQITYGQPQITYGQPPAAAGQPITNYTPPVAQGDVTSSQRPLQPAPSTAPPLVPIPEIQRSSPPGQGSVAPAAPGVPAAPGPTGTAPATTPANPTTPNPAATPRTTSPAPSAPGMPTVPGSGPSSATGAFPRLLEPTGHTTSWQPAAAAGRPALFMPAYPTAALPARLQQ